MLPGGELPYKSTQFNKHYADYIHKTKATMHLEHKPGETIQVAWAGQTAALVDTDTGPVTDNIGAVGKIVFRNAGSGKTEGMEWYIY